jgi:hypothetical protein
MNEAVTRYYLGKMTREEIRESSIKATRTKRGIDFKLRGRGIEFIEITAQLINSLAEKSNVSFETMLEILKAEYKMSKEIKKEDIEIKENEKEEKQKKLFNEVFKDLNL